MAYDFVFVSNTGRLDRPFYDPSSRYRSYALAEYFRRIGKKVAFLTQASFENEIESFQATPIIHFHRPKATEIMLRFVSRNKASKTLIADYDDLVFDVSSTRHTPAVADRNEDPTHIARSLAANAEVGAMFDHKTASTMPLAEKATKILGGHTKVFHNALDPIYLGLSQILEKTGPKPRYDIGYFSGTASHNKDLRLISKEIASFLKENTNASFLLFGPVALPEALHPYKNRIHRKSVVPFYEMPKYIRLCSKVLGPLNDNVFATCKSGLKFFEAGVLGTSVAATPIPDIDRFESPLLLKCRTSDDWAAALRAPLPSASARTEAAKSLRSEVCFNKQMNEWQDTFL